MSIALSESQSSVFIIIPVHNRKVTTLSCLQKLQDNGDLKKYRVVIVDDGSTDGTSEAIQAQYSEVTMLYGDGNLWWTGAIQMGMKYAYQRNAKYLIWLNDDCLVPPQAIATLIDTCRQQSKTIAAAQGYQDQSQKKIAFGGYLKQNSLWELTTQSLIITQDCRQSSLQPYDILNGNLVCIPREVIETIGFPDPQLSPHYFGDFIYTACAKKKGFSLIVQDVGKVYDQKHIRSNAYPKKWMYLEGKPWLPLTLIFLTPQSLINIKVNFLYFKVIYGTWIGLLYFFSYYIIRVLIPVFFITILRFLPLSYRQKISAFKRKMLHTF